MRTPKYLKIYQLGRAKLSFIYFSMPYTNITYSPQSSTNKFILYRNGHKTGESAHRYYIPIINIMRCIACNIFTWTAASEKGKKKGQKQKDPVSCTLQRNRMQKNCISIAVPAFKMSLLQRRINNNLWSSNNTG